MSTWGIRGDPDERTEYPTRPEFWCQRSSTKSITLILQIRCSLIKLISGLAKIGPKIGWGLIKKQGWYRDWPRWLPLSPLRILAWQEVSRKTGRSLFLMTTFLRLRGLFNIIWEKKVLWSTIQLALITQFAVLPSAGLQQKALSCYHAFVQRKNDWMEEELSVIVIPIFICPIIDGGLPAVPTVTRRGISDN